ncbi:MAG: LicD family protein [Lachnospiraceae bacterium]|nr:LicD family protein [Lachnospiraceae bacterium]
MRQLELREIQLKNLDLIKEFDALCREHEIDYRISGGTLLGAIRHKGFIPWDDDIDVMMLREEYDKLLNLKEKLDLPANRELISLKDKTFPRNFARYVRTDLVKHENMFEEDDCPWIGVDIFPVDFVPNDKRYEKQVNQVVFLRKLLLTVVTKKGTGKTKGKTIIKDVMRPFAKMMGSFRLAQKMENIERRYNGIEKEYVASIAGVYIKGERWKYEDFLPSTEVEFENYKLKAPANYVTYLTNMFGDYMQLPPEDKRKYSTANVYEIEQGEEND